MLRLMSFTSLLILFKMNKNVPKGFFSCFKLCKYFNAWLRYCWSCGKDDNGGDNKVLFSQWKELSQLRIRHIFLSATLLSTMCLQVCCLSRPRTIFTYALRFTRLFMHIFFLISHPSTEDPAFLHQYPKKFSQTFTPLFKFN